MLGDRGRRLGRSKITSGGGSHAADFAGVGARSATKLDLLRLPRSRAAFAATLSILIVLAYAPAWRFPFIQDDIGLFNWIGSQDLIGLWAASPFGYYRPLTQMVWKIGELLAGRFDPVLLHGVNLAVHTMNALIVGVLAGRWLPERLSERGRWLAGTLFALYPFTFQVVPFVGALYHPLVSMLILGALAGHQTYRSAAKRIGLGAAMLCALLAPFAHEAGLLAGPLLGLSELAWARTQRRPAAWPILAWAVATAAFGFAVWLSASKTGPQTARPDLNGILINLSYAVQGLTYPFGAIARSIVDATGVSDQIVLWIGGGLFIATASLAAWRGECRRLLAFGLLLWALGALPFSLTLVPRYTLAAAWLLYEQSIGAVWVWTSGILGFVGAAGSFRRARSTLAAIGAIAILIFSAWFIRTRMTYYERLSDSVWGLSEALHASRRDGDRSALVVNFPRLARPLDRVFPIGVESPQFYARLAGLRDALTVNGISSPENVQTLTFGNLMPPLNYSVETMGRDADWPDLATAIASVDRVYRGYPGPGGISVRYAGRQMEPASAAPLAQFDRSVALIDAEASLVEERLLAITLRWQYVGGADDAVVFAHVLNGAGELIAQSDGPVMDMLPFWQWPAGRRIEEVRYVALDELGAARVNVGVYDSVTGERLAPVDVDGRAYADGSVPLFEVDWASGTIRQLITR